MKSVKDSFDRAASCYDDYAEQQRHVCAKLAEMAAPYRKDWVLDVGCGTGFLKKHTGWPVIGVDLAPKMCAIACSPSVAADMHHLPFANASAPMLFSSLALQWSDEPAAALREWARVLAPGGYVVFSTYLSNTINELNECFKVVDEVSPLRQFVTQAEPPKMIKQAGLELLAQQQELLTREDNTLIELVSYMKRIGAGASSSSGRVLKTRHYWRQLEAHYPKKDGKVISSWEVGYFLARKPL